MNSSQKIIVINGTGGSGKSTFVSFCKEFDDRVIEISTVDFVKEVVRYAGWNGKKDEKGRLFLSDLKDCMEKYDDIPNKKICSIIESNPTKIFFINAREPKNIAYYKTKYDAITLLITNDRVPLITSNHADAHVFNYQYDFHITNNVGLKVLKRKAKEFMEYVNKEDDHGS